MALGSLEWLSIDLLRTSSFVLRTSEKGATRMLCPSCGHDNLPGADRCDTCMASLMKLDVPQPKSGLQERLMEDSISALRPAQPISLAAEASVLEAIVAMKERHVGCILVMKDGQLAG